MLFRERRHERYDYQAPVLFKSDRFTLWRSGVIMDISLGGILLKSDHLPRSGDLLEVRIANLFEGTLLALKAKVVRQVSAPSGPAVGLEFIVPSSSPDLVRLCKLLQNNRGVDRKQQGRLTSTEARSHLLQLARSLLDRAQFMDFYQTLEVPPDAALEQLLLRKRELLETFGVNQEEFSSQELKILQEALSLIKRLTGILTNPQRRLGYDVARGEVCYTAVKEAHDLHKIDLAPFEAFWEKKYPKRTAEARTHWERAQKAQESGDLHTFETERNTSRSLAPFSYV